MSSRIKLHFKNFLFHKDKEIDFMDDIFFNFTLLPSIFNLSQFANPPFFLYENSSIIFIKLKLFKVYHCKIAMDPHILVNEGSYSNLNFLRYLSL